MKETEQEGQGNENVVEYFSTMPDKLLLEKDRELYAAMKAEEKMSKSLENAMHQHTDANLVKAKADRKAMGLSDGDLRRKSWGQRS